MAKIAKSLKDAKDKEDRIELIGDCNLLLDDMATDTRTIYTQIKTKSVDQTADDATKLAKPGGKPARVTKLEQGKVA